jgi:hypothetical protein
VDHVGLGVVVKAFGKVGIIVVGAAAVGVGHALFGAGGAVFSGVAVVPVAAWAGADGGVCAFNVVGASCFISSDGAAIALLAGATGTACRFSRLLDPDAEGPAVEVGDCFVLPLLGGMTCTTRGGVVVLWGVGCDVPAGPVWK